MAIYKAKIFLESDGKIWIYAMHFICPSISNLNLPAHYYYANHVWQKTESDNMHGNVKNVPVHPNL